VKDLFHAVAGTSTGGILAIGLSKQKPLPAEELMQIYKKDGEKIFPGFWSRPFSAFGILAPKYSNDGLKSLLKDVLGDERLSAHSDERINDIALLITSFNIRKNSGYFFRNWRARGYDEFHGNVTQGRPQPNNDMDFLLRDIALATSAAPTYFPAAKIKNISGKDEFSLIDGGVIANNPAFEMVSEVLHAYPFISRHQITLVSIGTGGSRAQLNLDNAGLFQAKDIFKVLFDSPGNLQDQLAMNILDEDRNYRFQDSNVPNIAQMDDVSPKTLSSLESLGDKIISENQHKFDELIERLKVPKGSWYDFLSESGGGL